MTASGGRQATEPAPASGGRLGPDPADLRAALNEDRKAAVALYQVIQEHGEQVKALAMQLSSQESALSTRERALSDLLEQLLKVAEHLYNLGVPDPERDLASYQGSVQTAGRRLDMALASMGIRLFGDAGDIADNADDYWIDSTQAEPGVPDDTVLRVLQRGVRDNGALVRSARVITVKNDPGQGAVANGAAPGTPDETGTAGTRASSETSTREDS
jgi:molecular chaperone GrpE (heat shock protein)